MGDEDDISKMSRKQFREYHDKLERKVRKDAEEFMNELHEEAKQARDAKDAADFNQFLKDKLGVSMSDLQKEYDESADDEFKQRMKEIGKAVRKGDTGKARRLAKHKAIKDGAHAAKKRKSGMCALVLLGLLGSATVAVYGIAELISAVL